MADDGRRIDLIALDAPQQRPHANTPASEARQRGGKAPMYEDMTREELYERAIEIDIDGRAGMTREQLIDALRHH